MILLTFLRSVSYFFFLCLSPICFLWTVLDVVWPNIKVLSLDLSANKFVYKDFNVYHKDLIIHSGGTGRPGEPAVIFSLTAPYLDCWLFNSVPWRWFAQFCSFEFISVWWPQYLFYRGFPSIVKFWSFFFKFKMGCFFSYHSLCLFSSKRCYIEGYL